MLLLKKQWFTMVLSILILLAYLLANQSKPWLPNYSEQIKNVCIFSIFLISGLNLRTNEILKSITQWPLHLFIQGISFVLFPGVVLLAFNYFFSSALDQPLYIGFIILSCVPTTITSCVALTRMAQGNEAGALFNATLGNLAGIIVTPLLILIIMGQSIEIDAARVFSKLALLVVAPLIAGQILQHFIARLINKTVIALISQWLLLLFLFIIFLNAFNTGFNVSLSILLLVIVFCILLHLFFLGLSWWASGLFSTSIFNLADRKCATITATQKTLALGLPMIALLFNGNPDIALISLPLIIYHAVQLLIDGLLATKMSMMNE